MDEALRFQGVVRLATHFEFRKRDELWSTVGRKYIPAVNFGNGVNYEVMWEGNTCQLLSLGRLAWAVTDSRRSPQHRDTQNNRHPALQI